VAKKARDKELLTSGTEGHYPKINLGGKGF